MQPGQDLLPLLRDAAAGELVMAPGCTLESLMNATEIGDPRMDMGVVTDVQRAQPPFEPTRLLSAMDVLAVMDRLFACEMCFLDGHALASTVYTCLYTQQPDSFALDKLATGDHRTELVGLVLRAYVLVTLKTCDMIWLELIRGNLREGEDAWTDKASQTLLEELPADEVFVLLDQANDWLQSAVDIDDGLREQLMARLIFRTELFYTLCMLADPSSSMVDVLARLHDSITVFDRIDALDLPLEPPPGVFDVHVARTLQTHQPPRPVAPITFTKALRSMGMLLADFVAVLELITQSNRWAEWSLAFTCFGRRKVPAHPFIRSLLQSLFSADGDLCSTWPLRTLTDVFFADVAGLATLSTAKLTDKTINESDHPELASLGREWRAFGDALAGRLAGHLGILCADRSRQMRKLAQSLPEWRKLRARLERLGPALDAHLAGEGVRTRTRSLLLAIDHVCGLAMSESILAGFELDLYAAKEWRMALWAAHRIQRLNAAALDDLLRSRSTPALVAQRDLALVTAGLSRATVLLVSLAGLDTATGFAHQDMLRLRFERRFIHLPLAHEWEAYAEAMDAIAASGRPRLIEQLAEALDEAGTALGALKSLNRTALSTIGAGHCVAGLYEHLLELDKVAQMHTSALRALRADQTIALVEPALQPCAWFPAFERSR